MSTPDVRVQVPPRAPEQHSRPDGRLCCFERPQGLEPEGAWRHAGGMPQPEAARPAGRVKSRLAHHVVAKFALRPRLFMPTAKKTSSAHPMLLLSKSNPLRWTLIWPWVRIWKFWHLLVLRCSQTRQPPFWGRLPCFNTVGLLTSCRLPGRPAPRAVQIRRAMLSAEGVRVPRNDAVRRHGSKIPPVFAVYLQMVFFIPEPQDPFGIRSKPMAS